MTKNTGSSATNYGISINRNTADRISESKFNIFQTSITSVFWYRLSVAMISLSNCERPKRFYTRLRHLSKVRINFLVLCRVACAEFARIWVSYNVIHLLYLWTNDGSINISTSNKKISYLTRQSLSNTKLSLRLIS